MTVEQMKLPPIANRVELAVQSLWNAMDDLMAVPAEELLNEKVIDAAGRTLAIMAIFDILRSDLARKMAEVSHVMPTRNPYSR